MKFSKKKTFNLKIANFDILVAWHNFGFELDIQLWK